MKDVVSLTDSALPHFHCPDAASAKTAKSAPRPTVRVTAVSPATTARSATVAAQPATMETAAGKSAPAAGITNPVTIKQGSAGAVIQDGRDPGVLHVVMQAINTSAEFTN